MQSHRVSHPAVLRDSAPPRCSTLTSAWHLADVKARSFGPADVSHSRFEKPYTPSTDRRPA